MASMLQKHKLRASPLATLTSAYAALPTGGRLTLCIELDEPDGDKDLERRLAYVCSLARRCGFEPGARVTAELLCADGFIPICFERLSRSPRWRLIHLTADALDSFQALFRIVFGEPMSPALWQWKYGNDRGGSVAAYRDGRLVAHYGGSQRLVAAFGRKVPALQICDAMVDPAERAVMTKTGAMYQVTTTFLEIYQGIAAMPLAFGFPNRRAMRLGERLGLYAEVGAMKEVRWTALEDKPRLLTRARHLRPRDRRDRDGVNCLWTEMLGDLRQAVAVVRDWPYLHYRYIAHPERRYEILLVTSRITFQPLGAVVLRIEEEAVELLDLVAPLKRVPLLIDHARRLARRWGKETLYCWITRQYAALLGRTGGACVGDLDIRIPTNAWVHQDLTPAQLYDRWWLTSGDTDFH